MLLNISVYTQVYIQCEGFAKLTCYYYSDAFVVVYGDYSIFARQEATRNNFMQVR